jgi:hypothetical protein
LFSITRKSSDTMVVLASYVSYCVSLWPLDYPFWFGVGVALDFDLSIWLRWSVNARTTDLWDNRVVGLMRVDDNTSNESGQ